METQLVAEIKNSPAGLRDPIQRMLIKVTKRSRRKCAKCGNQYQVADVVTTSETRKGKKKIPAYSTFFFSPRIKGYFAPKSKLSPLKDRPSMVAHTSNPSTG